MKLSVLIPALLLAQAASAQILPPTYNLTGVWNSDGGGTLQVFQHDDKISMVFVGPDFAHQFRATYADPTHATGMQVRVTRANGCSTRMWQTFTALSPDFVSVRATALDSNCDLAQGQVIVNTMTRVI